jgi:hypothetical protein
MYVNVVHIYACANTLASLQIAFSSGLAVLETEVMQKC